MKGSIEQSEEEGKGKGKDGTERGRERGKEEGREGVGLEILHKGDERGRWERPGEGKQVRWDNNSVRSSPLTGKW